MSVCNGATLCSQTKEITGCNYLIVKHNSFHKFPCCCSFVLLLFFFKMFYDLFLFTWEQMYYHQRSIMCHMVFKYTYSYLKWITTGVPVKPRGYWNHSPRGPKCQENILFVVLTLPPHWTNLKEITRYWNLTVINFSQFSVLFLNRAT